MPNQMLLSEDIMQKTIAKRHADREQIQRQYNWKYYLIEFELAELRYIGNIKITDIGDENLYFNYTFNGETHRGFCKCL